MIKYININNIHVKYILKFYAEMNVLIIHINNSIHPWKGGFLDDARMREV